MPRTLLRFEQYLFTRIGPFSEENILFKLWKAIARYNKTLKKEERNALAVLIHKTFMSKQSKFCVCLPDELLDSLEPSGFHVTRPDTPALKSLQRYAEKSLKSAIEHFILHEGGQEGSQPSINMEIRSWRINQKKKVVKMYLQNLILIALILGSLGWSAKGRLSTSQQNT